MGFPFVLVAFLADGNEKSMTELFLLVYVINVRQCFVAVQY